MAIIMTLWICNGEVLKSTSQWQLKEFLKLNNSGHELFIFKILLLIHLHVKMIAKINRKHLCKQT